jgi:phosphoglycolate phosphatase
MSSTSGLVIFDLDGTLVDAFDDIRAALNHALAAHGLPLHDIQTVRGFVGNGLSALVRRAVPEAQHDRCPDIERLLRAHYAAHPADHARVYPGMADALAALRAAGLRTAVLSNKADALVQAIVDALGLRPLLDAVRGERPGVPLKPDPAAIHALLAELGGDRAVLVGDGLPDVEAARRAGIGFVGVAWGLVPAASLALHGPVTHDAAELPGLVLRELSA